MRVTFDAAQPFRLKWQVAAARFEIALRRHVIALKAGFDPNQPRVPAGSGRESGQWAYVSGWASPRNDGDRVLIAGPGASGRGGRYGPHFPGATPGQLIRLDQQIARAERAIGQVQQYEPNWRPTQPSVRQPGSIEGEINGARARADEAEARLQVHQQRTSIGGNQGPSLGPLPNNITVPSSRFDGQAWIRAYRSANNMPDLFGNPVWPDTNGTVTVADVDGRMYFGVNRYAPGYTSSDLASAYEWRYRLIQKYPEIMQTGNVGFMPNNSLFHAETTLLLRLARQNGGALPAKYIEMHVDNYLCANCRVVLPLLSRELGYPTIRIIDRNARSTLIYDGILRNEVP